MNLDKAVTPESGVVWNMSGLTVYANDDNTQSDQASARAAAETFVNTWKTRFADFAAPAVLAKALQEYELWCINYGLEHDIVGKSGVYWKLQSLQNSGDMRAQSKMTEIRLNAQYIARLLHPFELALGAIAQEHREQLLSAPELSRYASFLERTFETAVGRLDASTEVQLDTQWQAVRYNHLLPVKTALSTSTPFTYLPDDQNGPQSVTSLVHLMSDPVEAVRDSAVVEFNQLLRRLSGQAAEEMCAVAGHWRYENKLRHFSRPDQKRLVADRLPGEVVDSMLKAVSARYDISHRFYGLMAGSFGVKRLKYHERNLQMGDFQQSYTWPEARQLIEEVYAAIDPQFGSIIRQMNQQGLVDVYPRVGKATIENCIYFSPDVPPYVSLLFRGTPLDVVVSGHELAHMLHAELMKLHCTTLDYGTPAWMIELPAMLVERFFWNRLMQAADPQTRFALLAERCSRFVAMVFRQVAGYQFEQNMHLAIGPQSASEIGTMFRLEMARYMGPSVEQSLFSHNWWINWPHLRTPFYNSAYPLGMLVSSAMHDQLAADPSYLERIKEFLAVGLTAPFSRVMANLGLKTEGLWSTGIAEIETLLDELESLGQTLGYFESKVPASA